MNAEDLMELVNFWPARIILSAVELELFQHLAAPATVESIAAKVQTNPRATLRLLDALSALDVLDKHDETYEIAPGLRAALLPGPACILPSFQHRAVLWGSWSKLNDVVRTGLPAVEPYEDDERPDADVRSFIGAMAVGAHKTAPATVAALDLSGVRTVLDIGGGPGVYAMEFCKAAPGAAVTILDLPRVCEIARANLAGTGYSGRVGFVAGEVSSVDSQAVIEASGGKGFDLVFMSSLIHSMGPGQIAELVKRALGWTCPGGCVVVKDLFLDDSRTSPARAAVFSINMLVNTPEGASYTWNECQEMLAEAASTTGIACAAPERIVLGDGVNGMLLLRRMPVD
jgi:predicted O-methyltransferase YrrM